MFKHLTSAQNIWLALTLPSFTAAASDTIERITITTSAENIVAKKTYQLDNISKENIDNVQPQHIEQILHQISGVNFAKGSGQEYLPSLRSPVLNGAGACGRILTTLDGVPLRASAFCNVNELFESPFEFASSISVLKGPVSSLYGTNAVTAVINISTPDIESSPFNLMSLEAGSNEYVRGKLISQFGDTTQGLQLGVVGAHDGGFRDNSGYEQQKSFIKYQQQLDGMMMTHYFQATHLNQQTAGYLVGSDSYLDKSQLTTNANPEAFRKAHAWRYHSTWHDNDNTWQLTPYIRANKMEFLQHFLPGDPLEENAHQSLGLQSIYRFTAIDYQLAVGIDLDYSQGYLKQSSKTGLLAAGVPTGKHYDYDVSALSIAPFLQLTGDANINDSNNITWQLGLRAEHLSYRYDNNMIAGSGDEFGNDCNGRACRFSRPDDRRDNFTNLAPKFGLNYALNNDTSLFFNWSLGYRAPTHFELYRLQRQQNIADISSESANAKELGISGQVSALAYQFNIYDMTIKNVIFTDPNGFNVDQGITSHQGIEMQSQYQLDECWSLNVNAAYAIHQYEDIELLSTANVNGQDMDSAPRWLGNMQLSFTQAHWQAQLTARYQGKYVTDPQGLYNYPGHTVIDINSQWQINEQHSVSLRLNNLLDKRYADRADYSAFAGERYFPGKPRSLYLTWQYKL